jgi:hypothetical protein
MHLQVRCNPKLSPPDVEKFLDRLAKAGVNLGGAGGSNAEFGGEFAVALEDEDQKKATDALDKPPAYTYRVLNADLNPELTLRLLDNKVGALHAAVLEVTAENRKSGRKIRDVLVGVQRKDGKTPVQIYSE